MRRVLLAALVALAPGIGWAQSQSAPITATPLLPPAVQYPPPPPAYGQPQVVQQPAGPQPSPATPSPQSPPGQPLPTQTLPVQPPVVQAPLPPAPSPQGQPLAPGQPAPAVEQPAAPPLPNPWLPQGAAVLQVLDKVNAQTTTLTVKVGQTASYGSLRIAVLACDVRPPDMPPDAAASLAITDTHADQPGFNGWVLKSDPSASMLQHPIYDVRVNGCTP